MVDKQKWVGRVVQLKGPLKLTGNGKLRLFPAYTLGRVAAVQAHSVRLADPLTGKIFARSVPIKSIESVPLPTSAELADASLKRLQRDELEELVVELRMAVRWLKGASEAGDERLAQLYRLLPEHGLVGFDEAATARELAAIAARLQANTGACGDGMVDDEDDEENG